jgi:hypothetical protein
MILPISFKVRREKMYRSRHSRAWRNPSCQHAFSSDPVTWPEKIFDLLLILSGFLLLLIIIPNNNTCTPRISTGF